MRPDNTVSENEAKQLELDSAYSEIERYRRLLEEEKAKQSSAREIAFFEGVSAGLMRALEIKMGASK